MELDLTIQDIKIPLIIEDNDQEEYKEMISLLTEMIFTAPYERYIINILNKILKNNYEKLENLFETSDYSINDIINKFQEILNTSKKKKKNDINDSLRGQKENKEHNKYVVDKSYKKKRK